MTTKNHENNGRQWLECPECGREAPRTSPTQKTCGDPWCRRSHLRKSEGYRRKLELNRSPRKEARSDKRPSHVARKCRACGRAIQGPNYFYCHDCHARISRQHDLTMLE